MEGKNRPESFKDKKDKMDFELEKNLELQKIKIIESIKDNGLDASMDIISSWCDEAEKWAEKDDTKRSMVLINFAKYDFYIAANDLEGAAECATEAIYMAEQEGYSDIKSFIESKIKN